MPIRVVVSQISPPIRIVLVLAVAVLGMYMLFLRPKPVEVPPPTPAAPNLETDAPAVSEPGKLAEKAQEAAKASEEQTLACRRSWTRSTAVRPPRAPRRSRSERRLRPGRWPRN